MIKDTYVPGYMPASAEFNCVYHRMNNGHAEETSKYRMKVKGSGVQKHRQSKVSSLHLEERWYSTSAELQGWIAEQV